MPCTYVYIIMGVAIKSLPSGRHHGCLVLEYIHGSESY